MFPIGLPTDPLAEDVQKPTFLPRRAWPKYHSDWTIGVLPGPRANPDFMTNGDIEMLHATKWQVHTP